MAKAVTIPVTVKMRAGWDADAINAPELARRVEDAGAAPSRCTAGPRRSPTRASPTGI
jgi:2-methylisocitrate lyase-like PEP mutase family enzyme